jgi:O-antigen/teichoic acid export membrane protein
VTSPAPPDRRGLGRRASLGVTDQVLSSLTNFALNILVVATVSTDAYGTFALVFALYIVARGVIQALVAQPLLVRHTEPDRLVGDERGPARVYSLALGSSIGVGLVGTVLLAGGSLLGTGDLRASLLVLAAVLPGLMLQEVQRGVYFAQGRPAGALVIDGAWAVAQLALVGGLLAAGHQEVQWLILAWGISGTISAVLAVGVERLAIRLRGALGWMLGVRDLSIPFFGEIMTLRLSTQGVVFVLAGVGGLGAVGAFRSAQVLFSPLNVLLQAVPMVGIPEGVRLLQRDPLGFRRLMVVAGAAITFAFALWCAVVLLLPDAVGERLLGDSWSAAAGILPESSIFYVATAAGLGALIALRALQAARASFAARATGSAVGLLLGSVGAASSGASGAAWGLGAGAIVGSALLWLALARRRGGVAGHVPR